MKVLAGLALMLSLHAEMYVGAKATTHIQDKKSAFLFPGFLRSFGPLNNESFSVFCHPEERSDVGIQLNKISILNSNECTDESISVIRDAEIEETLAEMVKPIFKAAGLNPETAKVYVINSDSINAFTIGGGYIFINSGLLLKFKNPVHIIGILCHETAHMAAGHINRLIGVLQSRSNNLIAVMIASIIGMAVTGSPDAMALLLGYAISDERFFLRYSRSEEFAADALGASYLLKMGYSLDALIDVFYEFEQIDILNGGHNLPAYIRSHPKATDRISAIKRLSEKKPINTVGKKITKKLAEKYNRLRMKLRSHLKTIDYTSDVPTDPYSKVIYFHKIGKTSEALSIARDLIAANPNDIYYKETMAQLLYESGKIKEAIEIYKAICNDKTNILIKIDYANALLEHGENLDKAISILESAKYIDNLSEEIFRLLAKAYGKKGREGLSQLMLAQEQMLLRNYPRAYELIKSCLLKLNKKTEVSHIKKAKYFKELLERDYKQH
ncbi:peptidase M48 [Alphaproteobacteria bacterium]|nr:peptidase M48 [Alphaproteobacteria bacterium]